MQVREIASQLGASWEGDGDKEIRSVADIGEAGDSDLSFAASRKALEQAANSGAGCLIVPQDFQATLARTLIRAANPRGAFAQAVRLLHPAKRTDPGIHSTAVVALSAAIDPSASVGPFCTIGERAVIGAGTQLGAGCHVGDDSRLGGNCVLNSGVTIYHAVTIGARVVLHSGCVLGADGFGFVMEAGGYQKFPQVGRVQIGDDVEIGANSCVDRAALGVTVIGDGTKLDNMVHIAHNCRIGKHVVIAAQTGLSGGVVVEDYAVIGGQVGIGDKARIESRAVLGSGSGVLTSKIVHGGQVLWGTPARPLREYLEQLAHMNRLGDWKRRLDTLEKRCAELAKRSRE